ncbi:unnamed protein product [Caenorhabditis sp. 36 PRJEB53466]|nr:unnamed protein product [Caenorhabditis sp. 36 PRJEB53466]
MSFWFNIIVGLLASSAILLSVYYGKPRYEPLKIEPDDYWKLEEPEKDDDTIYAYSIQVEEKRISDFKVKLKSERFLPTLYDEESDQFMGDLKEVLLKFDWSQHQHFLNTFKQYRTEIEGLRVHFLRVSTPPTEPKTKVVPLLILHGFPGSFWDFFKIIPILTNPSRHGFDFGVEESIQFDVIVPSLPGFLFSDKPVKPGFDAVATTRILAKLMYRLDLSDYFVYGTEGYGGDVATLLASLYPSRVAGLQVSNPFVRPSFSTPTFTKYAWKALSKKTVEEGKEEEEARFTDIYDYYRQEKFTYPSALLIGDALLNSPSGTVKFIVTRWKQLSSFSGRTPLRRLFTLDEIATEIYLYWLTDSLPSALSILDNSYNSEVDHWLHAQVQVPTALSYSTETPWRCSKNILEDVFLNVTRVSDHLAKGGTFHQLQDGHKTAEDIFAFVEFQLLHNK